MLADTFPFYGLTFVTSLLQVLRQSPMSGSLAASLGHFARMI